MPGPNGFDSIIVGYYRGDDLTYVARARKALFGRRGASLEKKKKVNCAILAGPSKLMGSISPALACTSRGHRFLFLNVGY